MLRQLRYFQAVVRCGSFTEAAEECFISQSAISQQIQALERELGFQLLNRGNRGFTLTPAGEYFYQKSLILTADYEKICREASKIAYGDLPRLRLGYLRGYAGPELQLALAEFTEEFPEVETSVVTGNHEELYMLLLKGGVDLILSDQRRVFSEDYNNLILTRSECSVEISARNPIAQAESVEIADLKNTPCIIVSSVEQQENEREFYHNVVGFNGDFIFAENLEEARMMVAGGKGVMPVEGGDSFQFTATIRRLLLLRNGKPVIRNYCAFWPLNDENKYNDDFAEILEAQFTGKTEE